MKIFLLEPIGNRSFLLFDTMEKTFRERGHEFVSDPSDCDVVFFDLWTGLGQFEKRDVDKILFWNRPVVYFDFFDQWGSPDHRPNWWGFEDNGEMASRIDRGQQWAIHLKTFLEAGLIKLGFMRKMCKSWDYPEWVRPIECCLYPDHDFEPVSQDELMSRPNDICFIGNATPWRANFACDLAKTTFKTDFFFPHHRLPHDEWLHRHRQAKLFVEADGGGFGSERPYQLGTIAPMLRQRNDQRFAFTWSDLVNCVEPDVSFFGNLNGESMLKISRILEDDDSLYHIYLNGIDHLHTHYTGDARARYILEQMEGAGLK